MRRHAAALALAGWTAFVWLTRLRNAARDDESVLPYVLSVSFLVLAVGVIATLGRDRRWVLALAAWTVIVWPIRLLDIAASDHGVGFVVVHGAIGAVSIALAVVAVRAARAERRAVATPASHPARG